MAVTTLMNRSITSLENNEYVLGIHLDLSKASDSVDHVILPKRFAHCGIRCDALQYFDAELPCQSKTACDFLI